LRTIFIADAHRDDGRRSVVHADEKLNAFVEVERQVLTVTFPSPANLCAIASPIPVPAPVMIATLPSSRPLPAPSPL
jgi:hypothetical protein